MPEFEEFGECSEQIDVIPKWFTQLWLSQTRHPGSWCLYVTSCWNYGVVDPHSGSSSRSRCTLWCFHLLFCPTRADSQHPTGTRKLCLYIFFNVEWVMNEQCYKSIQCCHAPCSGIGCDLALQVRSYKPPVWWLMRQLLRICTCVIWASALENIYFKVFTLGCQSGEVWNPENFSSLFWTRANRNGPESPLWHVGRPSAGRSLSPALVH